jgi:hypothetical protein
MIITIAQEIEILKVLNGEKKINIDFSFNEWLDIGRKSKKQQNLKELAIKGLQEKATKLQELVELYWYVSDAEKSTVLQKITTNVSKASFEEKIKAYEMTFEKEIEEILYPCIISTDHLVFENLVMMANVKKLENQDLNKYALKKLKQINASFKQWRSVGGDEDVDNNLYRLSIEKMIATASCFVHWETILQERWNSVNEKQLKTILEKIPKTVSTFEECQNFWLLAHCRICTADIENIALEKIRKLELTFKEAEILSNYSMYHKKIKNLGIEIMAKKATDQEQWKKVLHACPHGSETEELAIRKIASFQ